MITVVVPESGPLLPITKYGLCTALDNMVRRAFTRRSLEESGQYTLECLCVRDAEMAGLNIEHMGCSGPTNVLSFPGTGTATPEGLHLGSLVVSTDAVYRESMLYRQEPDAYLLDLLAHGLGHLFGLDHGSAMDDLCAFLRDGYPELVNE